MEKPAILIIEDDRDMSESLLTILRLKGFAPVAADNGAAGLALLEDRQISIILLDLGLPDTSGLELLKKIKAGHPLTEAIILTGNLSLDTAIECMKEGACDYLVKPLEVPKLLASINRAIELRSLNNEIVSLKHSPVPLKPTNEAAFADIISRNKEMQEIFRYMEIISVSKQPVLITGETGVGKELFAQTIHNVSGCSGPFVCVNVAGIDDMLFSDTLFGHQKGAYTGADTTREGLIAKAAQGTLFLDEIGDLGAASQVKLLRLLQEQEYYRLGSDTPIKSKARLVIATNRDLKEMVNKGEFRKDLYYRLSTHQLRIPPLRERVDDIPLLLSHFIMSAARTMGKKAPSYPHELVTLLSAYEFPGNVRELQAMVFDMVARSSFHTLSLDGFKDLIKHERSNSWISPGMMEHQESTKSSGINFNFSRFPTLKEAERTLIDKALELAKGNQGVAASLLGISRQALNSRLQRKN